MQLFISSTAYNFLAGISYPQEFFAFIQPSLSIESFTIIRSVVIFENTVEAYMSIIQWICSCRLSPFLTSFSDILSHIL